MNIAEDLGMESSQALQGAAWAWLWAWLWATDFPSLGATVHALCRPGTCSSFWKMQAMQAEAMEAMEAMEAA